MKNPGPLEDREAEMVWDWGYVPFGLGLLLKQLGLKQIHPDIASLSHIFLHIPDIELLLYFPQL